MSQHAVLMVSCQRQVTRRRGQCATHRMKVSTVSGTCLGCVLASRNRPAERESSMLSKNECADENGLSQERPRTTQPRMNIVSKDKHLKITLHYSPINAMTTTIHDSKIKNSLTHIAVRGASVQHEIIFGSMHHPGLPETKSLSMSGILMRLSNFLGLVHCHAPRGTQVSHNACFEEAVECNLRSALHVGMVPGTAAWRWFCQ